jgi:hypothetical protein
MFALSYKILPLLFFFELIQRLGGVPVETVQLE